MTIWKNIRLKTAPAVDTVKGENERFSKWRRYSNLRREVAQLKSLAGEEAITPPRGRIYTSGVMTDIRFGWRSSRNPPRKRHFRIRRGLSTALILSILSLIRIRNLHWDSPLRSVFWRSYLGKAVLKGKYHNWF